MTQFFSITKNVKYLKNGTKKSHRQLNLHSRLYPIQHFLSEIKIKRSIYHHI